MKNLLRVCLLLASWMPASGATFTVTSTSNDGPGTLRQALLDANSAAGPDRIEFKIPGSGVKRIVVVRSVLPEITDPVDLDATTQPGYAGTPLIELDANQRAEASALTITAGNSVVRGLAIGRTGSFDSTNPMYGIALIGAGGSRIEACHLGVDATGFERFGSVGNVSGGVLISNSVANVIGGRGAGSRNVISGNARSGVQIGGSGSISNVVTGNFIGLAVDGLGSQPNQGDAAVLVTSGAQDTLIGGRTPEARNLIVPDNADGVVVEREARRTRIEGNWIGLLANGSRQKPERGDSRPAGNGVRVNGALETEIGGPEPGAGNVISGNQDGVRFSGTLAGGTRVRGNFIGTDPTGTLAQGNHRGVSLPSGFSGGQIGGPGPAEGNLISGNVTDGVNLAGAEAQVQGNFIGTDVTGLLPLGNGRTNLQSTAITVSHLNAGATNNLIGGSEPGTGNLISGNAGVGITVLHYRGSGLRVQGNVIGLDRTGTRALGNRTHGIELLGAAHVWIGGTNAGEGNVISANGGAGIRLRATFGGIGEASSNNVVVGNVLGLALPTKAPTARTGRPAGVLGLRIDEDLPVRLRDLVGLDPGDQVLPNAGGGVVNDVAEATCVGMPGFVPANLFGIGDGGTGIQFQTGSGHLHGGNTYLGLGNAKFVTFASSAGLPARPVLTSAVRDADQAKLRVTGFATGLGGTPVVVEFSVDYPFYDGLKIYKRERVVLGEVAGFIGVDGRFDFDQQLSGFTIDLSQVTATVRRGPKLTSDFSLPKTVPPPVAPAPRIGSIQLKPDGKFSLSGTVDLGGTYQLQAAPTLSDLWSPVLTLNPSPGPFTLVVDPAVLFQNNALGQGFLRLVKEP